MGIRLNSINESFNKLGIYIVKFRWVLIVLVLLLDVFAFTGLKKIKTDVSNESLFLPDDPVIKEKKEFEEKFGNNDFVSILVEADDIFDHDILVMMQDLGQELLDSVPYSDKIISLVQYDFITSNGGEINVGNIIPDIIPTSKDSLDIYRKKAFGKSFLVNRLFSDDSKQAWITLRLDKFPEKESYSLKDYPLMVIGKKVLEIVNQDKYKKFKLKATGNPVMTYEKRSWYGKEGLRLISLTFVIVLLLLILLTRSFSGVFIPVFTSVSSIIWVFGAMGWLGIEIDNSVMTVPIFLGLAVSLGYSIHIFNFFGKNLVVSKDKKEAAVYAISHTGWPILFTVFTTIAGLFSFYFVNIKTVRWMGAAAGCTVLASYIILMLFTPSVLSLMGQPFFANKRRIDRVLDNGMEKLGNWSLQNKFKILILFTLVIVFFIIGLFSVEVDMDMKRTNGIKIPYTSTLDYISKTKVGTLYAYDIAIKLKEGAGKVPENLIKIDSLEAMIYHLPIVKRTASLADIVKDMNFVFNDEKSDHYVVPKDKGLLNQLLLLYEVSGGDESSTFVDYDYSTLRIKAEVDDFSAKEINRELPIINACAKKLFPDGEMQIVGSIVQFAAINNYIARGQLISLVIALIVITIIMAFVFSSVKTGLIAMIPNVATIVVTGGLMGYFDVPIDFMTMIIAPMIIGIAVDDTIHFINHCKYEFEKSHNYKQAVQETYKSVGKALLTTSVIIILGYVSYLTSLSNMFLHIGTFTIIAISMAILADLLVTPLVIIWFKPFGKESKVVQNE